MWDDCTYRVRLLKPRPSKRRVTQIKVIKPVSSSNAQIRLQKKIILRPYSAGIYVVSINEEPETLLDFESALKLHGSRNALCLQVNVDKEVHIPLVNSTNSRVSLKVGTLIGTYNTIDERDIS